MVPRTRVWKSTYALVVISPAITTRPVAVRVSQATRLMGSSARQASSTESEIWSAILSGCPSVTDSEVKRYGLRDDNLVSPSNASKVRCCAPAPFLFSDRREVDALKRHLESGPFDSGEVWAALRNPT